ncbi:hypothetical protein [Streptomyces uncialis]|uniref:hypothetical protein n=1 Tax=Streptomyces uncialis TaxID=1048205 RepID=UPI0038637DF9|nr:hypothetical protein OG924_33985 [Streptomyces uncialis]
MRAIVRASGAVSAAVALAAAGVPAAMAEEGAPSQEQPPAWEVGVSPGTVRPGETVTLSSKGCQVPAVAVDSGIFDAVELDEGRSAPAEVFPDALPGAAHEVTFTCDGQAKRVKVTVAEAGDGPVAEDREREDDGTERLRPGEHEPVEHPPEREHPQEREPAHEPEQVHPEGHEPQPPGGHREEHPERKGVRAGSGGDLGEPGPVQLVLGGALIAGALGGAGYFLWRRRA